MTEEEAKTKWCPHKRVAIVSEDLSECTPAHNQVEFDARPELGKYAVHYRCIGSACMAWRWLDDEPGCEAGFCGLASRP